VATWENDKIKEEVLQNARQVNTINGVLVMEYFKKPVHLGV